MSSPGPKARPSRATSDAKRSAATRERLLDAAFECLVELGYARTTTVEICRRAEAPRGTLLHHYPNRDDLILAAVGHVLDRRLVELEAAFTQIAGRQRAKASEELLPVELVIDELWKVVSGPTMHAWLELLVAARTNPDLHARFRQRMTEFDQRVHQTYRVWFGQDAGEDSLDDTTLSFTFALLNGLSLDWQYKEPDEVTPVLAEFKTLAGQMFKPRGGS